MASGHVNRTQRPNTWLHRPSLQREISTANSKSGLGWQFTTSQVTRFHFCTVAPDAPLTAFALCPTPKNWTVVVVERTRLRNGRTT